MGRGQVVNFGSFDKLLNDHCTVGLIGDQCPANSIIFPLLS